MKNQKGITLIALVITIIVLLILAGVSIAMLTGENGILTRANSASMRQIEGQVVEEVKLAVQAAKMYAEEQATKTSTGWLAHEKIADVDTEMEKDLTSDKGYTVDSAAAVDGTATITVTYETAKYDSATNYASATIVATIKVTNNTFKIDTIVATRGTDATTDVVYLEGSAPANDGE